MTTIRALVAAFLAYALYACDMFDTTLPNRYAIVFGVANYARMGSLLYSDDDAISVSGLCLARGIPSANIHLAIDNAATYAQLLADIAQVNAVAKPEDMVVFYYSGHGAGALHTADPNDTIRDSICLYDRDVADFELRDILRTLVARKRVVILDSCHSGGIVGNGGTATSRPDSTSGESSFFDVMRRAREMYFAFPGSSANNVDWGDAVVLAAASEGEFSYDGGNPIFHGVFTYFLLHAADKGDMNRDGWISLLELYYYATASIDASWNPYAPHDSDPNTYPFIPRITGTPIDYVLFKAP